MAEHDDALALFLELAVLPSPPGEERAVADVVLRYLRDLGLEPDEDGAGAEIESTMGNIYVRLEPTAEGTPLFFCAHLDTVPPSGPLEPVVDEGVVRNAGAPFSGPTTSRPSSRCSRPSGACSQKAARTPASS
jgi:tripeptide aminopeptidase